MDPQPTSPSSNDFITLKIVVPHASACKTVRLPTKIKIRELHGILTKKLSSQANSSPQVFEDFGFHWHSDSGPVWLADASALRAYSFKPGVSIEFKKRSTTSPGTKSAVENIRSKSKKEKKEKEKEKEKGKEKEKEKEKEKKNASPRSLESGEPIRLSAIKKMAGWVSSRPGSFYDHKKEKEKEDTQKGLKKERSQSVHLSPMKDPEIVVNAARFTSPSFSSTFEVSTTSPLIDEDSSSNSSPRAFDIPASLDDLDDLIDDFDDLADDYDGSYDDDALLDDYVASVEDEDLLEFRQKSNDSPRYNNYSPRFVDEDPAPKPLRHLPPNITRQRSYSSPHGTNFLQYLTSKSTKSTPSGSPRNSSSPDALDDSNPEDFRKVPGLNSEKRDSDPASNSVRLAAATSILEDALEGIETHTVDMVQMKHLVTSALCILRTIS